MTRTLLAAAFLLTTSALPAQTPSALEGTWLGKIADENLRIQLTFQQTKDGWSCTASSPDQGVPAIPCKLTSATNPIAFEISIVGASFQGTHAGNIINGTFAQRGDHALMLTRQSGPATTTQPPDSALPPADLSTIKAILDKDLAPTLKDGALAPATHGGVTIGILSHGQRLILSYGTAKEDSVFEIGSITKTFTGLILAQMVEQKAVRYDEPVRELLPPGTVAKPVSDSDPVHAQQPSSILAPGREITLLDLSDQHSGLPRMPDNFHPADPKNPYADYDSAALYAYIQKHGVALADNTPFGYSNLGVGLLGNALATRANVSYGQLLHQQITGPLGMMDTGVILSPAMRDHFIQGYSGFTHKPAHEWDLNALSGAGGIRSNAADMLTYLQAQLHPEALEKSPHKMSAENTLPAAIAASHQIRAQNNPQQHIALNWFVNDNTGDYWHNGATGGYSSYATFNPKEDWAVIVLFNTNPGNDNFADKLGKHIAQRLTGKPAISLAP